MARSNSATMASQSACTCCACAAALSLLSVGAMLVFGVLVRSHTQVRSLSRCASVGALHASAVLCVGGLPPSDYGIHATGTVTNTEGINDKVLASSPIQLYL